jgi:hypothetical protein
MKPCITLSLAVLVLAASAPPAAAITYGEIDVDDQFPNVGAIVLARGSGGRFAICSGTLIHPRLFLTAGHCTRLLNNAFASGNLTPGEVRISFGVDALDDATWREIDYVVTDPLFLDNVTNASDLHDQGLVILKEPVLDRPSAVLADVGFLDALFDAGLLRAHGVASSFVVVGYGTTLEFPPPQEDFGDIGIRRFAASQFQALYTANLFLNQNPRATDGGGIGQNDSGGPMFWIADDGAAVLVAVSFYGITAAFGQGYRVDWPDGRQFIDFYLELAELGML